jgi:RNA polymerase sigma-70 factor (ECF subfamily)
MAAIASEDRAMAPGSTFLLELIPYIERSVRNSGVRSSDRDDARQNVLLQLHRHAARLQTMPPDQLQRYARAVVSGISATLRRSYGRREHLDIDRDDVAAKLPASSGLPDVLVDRQRLVQTLMNQIRKLAPHDRKVLELVELEEHSVVAAAGVLGIPVGTAATRLRRARAFLAKLLHQRSRTILRICE